MELDRRSLIAATTGLLIRDYPAAARPRGGTAGSLFQFNFAPRILTLGDSLCAHENRGAGPGTQITYSTNEGVQQIAQAIKPNSYLESWPYDTSSEDAGHIVKWTHGANMAVDGSTLDYIATFLPYVYNSTAEIFHVSPTINSVTLPDPVGTMISDILDPAYNNTAKFMIIGSMKPVCQGSSFDGPGYVAAYYAIRAGMQAWCAGKPASRILFCDWDQICDPSSTGYLPANYAYDGVHFNGYGAAVIGAWWSSHILGQIIDPSVNLWPARIALTNHQPNPALTGTGGARSGTVAYGGPGLSVPTGYKAVNGTGTVSTAVVTLEANTTYDPAGQNVVFTATFNAADTNGTFAFEYGTNGAVADPTLAGLYAGAVVEFETDNNAAWGAPSVQFVDNSGSGNASRGLDEDGTGQIVADGTARIWKVFVDPCFIPLGSPGYKLICVLRFDGSKASSPTGVVKVRYINVASVGAPQPRWNIP